MHIENSIYSEIKHILHKARNTVYYTANHAMVTAYWEIGKILIEKQGGNETARTFYEDECVKSNWSTRQLERQINSFFYERLLSSQEKETVTKENFQLDPQMKMPKDIIRDPYVLEFLGIAQDHKFLEKDLEGALITHLPEEELQIELNKELCHLEQEKELGDVK